MSGWHPHDRTLEDNMDHDFPSSNNITIGGSMPSDQVPTGGKDICILHLQPEAGPFLMPISSNWESSASGADTCPLSLTSMDSDDIPHLSMQNCNLLWYSDNNKWTEILVPWMLSLKGDTNAFITSSSKMFGVLISLTGLLLKVKTWSKPTKAIRT